MEVHGVAWWVDGWRVMYRDSDDVCKARYEIRRSELLMHVHGDTTPTHDAMYGMYASRRYTTQEAITVCMWARI